MKITTIPFDPVEFIGEGWSLISEEQDKISAALEQVDMSEAEFIHYLKEGETYIKGEEKLERLKQGNYVRLGSTVFLSLWQDYQENKEKSIIEQLHQKQGITYIDFPGDVLLSPGGDRCVLCLCRDVGGFWSWSCSWLGDDWDARDFSAVLQQVS